MSEAPRERSHIPAEVLRRARNRAVGLLAFEGGRPVRDRYADAHLILRMLDLDRRAITEDITAIGHIGHPDPVKNGPVHARPLR